jgi:hypothetical protein
MDHLFETVAQKSVFVQAAFVAAVGVVWFAALVGGGVALALLL